MKQLFMSLLSILLLSSCDRMEKIRQENIKETVHYTNPKKFMYDGHRYIKFWMDKYNIQIIHDPDCPKDNK